MPSQTFYNLSEEKRKKLVKVALEEFSKVPFSDVSINTIIAKAEISRGSFYMYFQDKEDLFRFLLESHKQAFQKMTREAFQHHDGDLFSSFTELFDGVLDYVERSENKEFIRNVFLNLNARQEGFLIPHGDRFFHKHPQNEILELVNRRLLKVQTDEDLIVAIRLLMDMTIQTIMSSICRSLSKEETKKIYLKKIEMLQYGIERRESC